jgi:tRNA (guanosine-2'-O-)-methyltransferase
MRRRTPGVLQTDELVPGKIARIEAQDPLHVIRSIEPFVNERRRARLLEVIGARLGSVEVVFEAPHDPHNGAAVVRSCEAFGVQTLRIVESKGERFLTAASVARGAQKWIDVLCHQRPEEAIEAVRERGLELVAAHPEGELLPADLATIPRLALVLGNEHDGIGAALAAACSRRVRVPMRGFVESLNVSVTAALLLSAATTGRAGDLPERDRVRLYARGLYFSSTRPDDLIARGGNMP